MRGLGHSCTFVCWIQTYAFGRVLAVFLQCWHARANARLWSVNFSKDTRGTATMNRNSPPCRCYIRRVVVLFVIPLGYGTARVEIRKGKAWDYSGTETARILLISSALAVDRHGFWRTNGLPCLASSITVATYPEQTLAGCSARSTARSRSSGITREHGVFRIWWHLSPDTCRRSRKLGENRIQFRNVMFRECKSKPTCFTHKSPDSAWWQKIKKLILRSVRHRERLGASLCTLAHDSCEGRQFLLVSGLPQR